MKTKTFNTVLLLIVFMLISNWASAQVGPGDSFVEYVPFDTERYVFSAKLDPPEPLYPDAPAHWTPFWIFGNGDYSKLDEPIEGFSNISGTYTVFCEATPRYSKPGTATQTTTDNLGINQIDPNWEHRNPPEGFIELSSSRGPRLRDRRVMVVSYRNRTPEVQTNITLSLFFNDTLTSLVENDQVFAQFNTSTLLSAGIKSFNREEKVDGSELIVPVKENDTYNKKIVLNIPYLGVNKSFSIFFRFLTSAPPETSTVPFKARILLGGEFYTQELEEDVVTAYDPNEKDADTEEIFGYNITNDPQIITYKIDFQNYGNAPATSVSIYDTITELLNVRRITFTGASHRPSSQEVIGNVIVWHFDDIYLPGLNQPYDSLLPFPQPNPGGSSISYENVAWMEATKGWVTFEIATYTEGVYSQIPPGPGSGYLYITNDAEIVFNGYEPGVKTPVDSIRISSGFSSSKLFNNGENTNSITNAYKEQLSVKSIYPNPCSEDVVIEMELAGEPQNCKTEIIDLTGKVLIAEEKFNSSEGLNPIFMTLNTSILPAGVYLIRVVYGDNTIVNKLIKR